MLVTIRYVTSICNVTNVNQVCSSQEGSRNQKKSLVKFWVRSHFILTVLRVFCKLYNPKLKISLVFFLFYFVIALVTVLFLFSLFFNYLLIFQYFTHAKSSWNTPILFWE